MADGTLDTESDGTLNVVFIGGSLTELGKDIWTTGVANYLQELFPNKTVNHYNSGIGGTNSEAGAARFCEHVAPYDPDIIFIEFTVNDDQNGFSHERAQYRMENFLYQCSQLEKIPTVIYLHTPPADTPDSAVYQKWAQQASYKQEWADHYGISTVNIYDYTCRKYEEALAAGETTDFVSFLDKYYGDYAPNDYGLFDVHGGYDLYLEAITEALEENAEEMLAPYRFMPYMHTNKTEQIERTHVKAAHDDEMFNYSEGWKVHTKGNSTSVYPIGAKHWETPFLVDGIHEGEEGATVTFTTDANDFTLYYMSIGISISGAFEIYVNGQYVKTIETGARYVQPTIKDTIELNNPDHEDVNVTIKIVKDPDSSAEKCYARFTSIWFGYND